MAKLQDEVNTANQVSTNRNDQDLGERFFFFFFKLKYQSSALSLMSYLFFLLFLFGLARRTSLKGGGLLEV